MRWYKVRHLSGENTRSVLVFVMTLLGSVLAAFAPRWSHAGFSKGEDVVLGATVFCALTLLEIFLRLGAVLKGQRERLPMVKVESEGDLLLHNIRTHFHGVVEASYGPNDRYVKFFLEEFRRLQETVSSAHERKELRVENSHFLGVTDVLGAFGGDVDAIYRYTWPLSDGPLFSIPAWRHFFQLTATMIKQRQIREVRVLMLYEDLSSFERVDVQQLLRFYAKTRNFNCKIVSLEDWQIIARDNSVPVHHVDIGIYGKRMVYVTESENPPETVGKFLKEPGAVTKYTAVFDSIWDADSIAFPSPHSDGTCPTLDDLFARVQTVDRSAHQTAPDHGSGDGVI